MVYVDNDPIVLAHARALLTSGPRGMTGFLNADARQDPRRSGPDPGLRAAGVMLVAILHCVPDEDDPCRLVARLLEAVPPGSFLVMSHSPSDMQPLAPGAKESAEKMGQLMGSQVTPRTRDQVSRFFDGLDLIEPGIVPIQNWRPDSEAEAAARAAMWGAVGRKP